MPTSETSRVMRALARRRWEKTTKAERSEHGRRLVAARWEKRKVRETTAESKKIARG